MGILTLLVTVAGCATQRADHHPKATLQNHNTDGMAMALVFDPPVTLGRPPIELPRSARSAAAFGSYRNLVATYFSIHTLDRQTNDWRDRYERRTEMNRVGVSYR